MAVNAEIMDLTATGLVLKGQNVFYSWEVRRQVDNFGDTFAQYEAWVALLNPNDSVIDSDISNLPSATATASVFSTISGSGSFSTEGYATGDYEVSLAVDAFNEFAESDETDNNLKVDVFIRDALHIDVFSLAGGAETVLAGGSFDLDFRLFNDITFTGQDISNYEIDIVLSPDTTFDGTDRVIGSFTLGELALMGGAYDYDRFLTAPADFDPGTYNIGLILDPDDDFDEPIEDRTLNLRDIEILAPEYDLVPSGLALSSSAAPDGAQINVSYTLTNAGTLGTLTEDFAARYELVKVVGNLEIPIEVDTSQFTNTALAPSGALLISELVTLDQGPTPIAPGEYLLRVSVDSDNGILEIDETNNSIETSFTILPTPSNPPATGGSSDFDANGSDDILFFNETTRTVGQFEMPTGSWGGIGTAGVGWEAVGTGLFDTDDVSTDILWFNQSTGGVGRFDMDGGVIDRWDGIGFAGAGWDVMGAGDFNGDGVDDILWFNASTNTVGQFRMIDTKPNWVSIGKTGAGWDVAGIADFNGDGIDDILWENASTGKLGRFEMSATDKTWISGPTMGAGWAVAGTGDFLNDTSGQFNEFDDILVFNESTRKVGIYDFYQLVSNGDERIEWVSLGGSGAGWGIEGTGDFDGSGTDDILWRNENGSMGQFSMNGNGPSYDWENLNPAGIAWDVML